MGILQAVADFYLRELTPDALDTMLRETPDTAGWGVGSMFTWYGTPEGRDYWSDVNAKYYSKFGYTSANGFFFKNLRPYLELHRTPKELIAMERLKPWRQ
jgi:hypothetical protein